MKCNNCDSDELVKYGKRKRKSGDVQIYLCNSCGVRSTFGKGLLYTDRKKDLVAVSLDLYCGGLSLRQIREHLKQFYGTTVSHTTIYYWIANNFERIDDYVSKFPPKRNDLLNADETGLYFRKNLNWLWLIQDKKSRFIVGSRLAKYRSVMKNNVFSDTKEFLKKDPEKIITDGLHSYYELISTNFPSATHKRYTGIAGRPHNNMIERTNGEVKSRYRRMRGFHSIKTGNRVMNGWKFYHNFVKPHMGIGGMTPAEKGGVDLKLGVQKWHDIITRIEQESKNS